MKPSAAILAGGLGTRLRSVVNDRPKVMAMVAGRPFLTHLLDQLVESGIKKVVLCTGYMAETIRHELGTRYRGLDLVYSVEKEPLGTGGALRQACELLVGDDKLLILNGDSYCRCNLSDFIDSYEESGLSAGMVLAQADDIGRFGAVQLNKRCRVESFIEKGTQSGAGWINAGIYLFPISRIQEIMPGNAVSLEREVIPNIISDGLYGYHCTGSFIDIGIPEEYQRAQIFFSEEKKGKP